MGSGAQAAVDVGVPVLMVVPLLSLFHLDGQRGCPSVSPGPPLGLTASRAALQSMQFTWFSFILASCSSGPVLLVPSSRAVSWTMRFTSNKILGGGSLQECIFQAPRSELRPPCQVPADTEDRFPVRSPTCHEPSFSSRQRPPSLSQRGCLSL